jgi:hypothetical protein
VQSQKLKHLALVIMALAFVAFVYGTFIALKIVDKTQMSTSSGVYVSYVSTSKEIEKKALMLSKMCESKLCKIQKLLDFASNIPYSTNAFQKHSPQKTIQKNFGDCDDKSNLLISMLHVLEIEAYFVLVPKHIFVIVPLEDNRLAKRKGLWMNGKKYYILESTAKNSEVGYPLQYRLDEIDVIIEPFSNTRVKIDTLNYKL